MKRILLYSIYGDSNNETFLLDSESNRDDCHLPPYHLKAELAKHGYVLDTIDMGNVMNCDYIFFYDLPSFVSIIRSHPFLQYMCEESFKKKMIAFLWEPPVVNIHNWIVDNHQYFDTIFTWFDDAVDHNKYIKFQYPQPDRRYAAIPFQLKKLCTMINGNKSSDHPQELYSERRKAIRFFEQNHPEDFDLYGFAWDPKQFPSYRGTIREKGEILRRYKFAICYENMGDVNGYITEKIFDCFRAGCVPVYLGAANVTRYIPEDTFVDFSSFNGYEELYRFLTQMSEETYNRYLSSIEQYLISESFDEHFSIKAFCRTVVRKMIDLDREVP